MVLAQQVARLPLISFDLLCIARFPPKDIVTFGIDQMIDILLMMRIGVSLQVTL